MTTDVLVLDGSSPASPRPGAWRRRALILGAAVVALVLAGGVAFPGLLGAWSGRSDGTVPGVVERPWDWQATLAGHPNGPASIVVTGDGWGTAADPTGQAVIGTDGTYRMLDGRPSFPAGVGTLVSPDGRYLAGPATADPYSAGELAIVDLTDGSRRVLPGVPGNVRAWRPDGGAVVVTAAAPGNSFTDAYLVDLATGRTRGVFVPSTVIGGEFPVLMHRPDVAFSPDGRLIATGAGNWVAVSDEQGGVLWRRDLGPGLHLAGRGAVTPDGHRIAILAATECRPPCVDRQDVSYVDTLTGLPIDGPDLSGLAASVLTALGWHGDELLVAAYEPVRDRWVPDVWGLAPRAQPRLVVNLPPDATGVDIPANLIRDGRLGTAHPVPGLLPLNTPTPLLPLLLPLSALLLTLLATRLLPRSRTFQRVWRSTRVDSS